MIALLLLTAFVLADSPDTPPALLQETVITDEEEFVLEVPNGWRRRDGLENETMLLYLSGDGRGVPLLDENGAPLQIGLAVEKFLSKEALEDGVADILKAQRQHPLLKLLAEPQVEDVRLSEKTSAILVSTQFLKPPGRRSLQLKLCLKDKKENSWVVSGWVVAGEESELPEPNSPLAKRLREIVMTFSMRKQ